MESNSCFMEKKRLRSRDILRMDGLLPPTRRLPVCNAVTSTSDKKKEKKWSIGGILKRISSIRDDDSSSNEEEIMYCKKQPRNPAKINKQPNNIVLHPVKSNCERRIESNNKVPETNVERSMESLNVQRDSLQSRSSDGSLEGLVRKIRKNKIKARVEAKRDQLCPNSSSDEDSRVSNNSLPKQQSDDYSLNVCKTNSYNRRTRAARTERYIKRLFKEEVYADDGNQINSKQNSLESFEEAQRIVNLSEASKPVTYPRQSTTRCNDYTTTMHKPAIFNSQIIEYNTNTRSMEDRNAARNTRSSNERSKNLATNIYENEIVSEKKDTETSKMEVAAQERKRWSKNLEDAISELEAIYNSLRLGDEDLLDRAERRSMEEFSLRRGQVEDEPVKPNRSDSPDRLKDDMAYRRMHPVERPVSLSDIIGQSLLSNISYLIASPVLSRIDNASNEPKSPINTRRRDEPDVTRDDVVFRSIHRANNTLKVVEPQPPFGIPLRPVTTATESDYLHTVPNKSNPPRSSYIPQCEPDIVTDDLAFRTLRKDTTNTVKSNGDNQTNGESVNSEFPTKKKRAVKSLSANLYGLINQERIHLHRQPSLCEIKDDIESINGSRKFLEKPDHFRRVVSDGELSDQGNVRWHAERYSKKGTLDINGNHPDSGLCRKMLRVYVSPSTTMQWPVKDSKSREETPTSTFVSATRRTSSGDVVQNLWKTNREESSRDKESRDSDFTAYSRLCQDLVDTIKGTGDGNVNINDQKKIIESQNSLRENKMEMEPLITELCNALLDDSEPSSESLPKETKKTEMDEGVCLKLDEINIVETEDDKLDYYLRLANENVKMIAEAFSSVADHLRDGLDVRNDSSSRLRTDSDATCETSTRSSSLMVEVDENDKTQEDSSTSSKNEFLHESPKNVAPGVESNESVGKLEVPSTKENCVDRRSDIEVDLNKAVEDLQLAAASLSGSIQEMEELEVQLAKLNENRLFIEEEKKGSEKDDEERKLFIVEKKDVSPEFDLGQGGKYDDEESTMSKPLEAEDGNERVVAVREGERNVCEMIDCTAYHENQQLARAMEMRVPYVTNIITITITEYSMVLLACLLALLLVIVAAS